MQHGRGPRAKGRSAPGPPPPPPAPHICSNWNRLIRLAATINPHDLYEKRACTHGYGESLITAGEIEDCARRRKGRHDRTANAQRARDVDAAVEDHGLR